MILFLKKMIPNDVFEMHFCIKIFPNIFEIRIVSAFALSQEKGFRAHSHSLFSLRVGDFALSIKFSEDQTRRVKGRGGGGC